MARNLPIFFMILAISGCEVPAVDDVLWRCTAQADCGADYVCVTRDGLCHPADRDGRNGVFDDRLLIAALVPQRRGPAEVALRWQEGLLTGLARQGTDGIHGRRVEVVFLDDGHDPEVALTATTSVTARRQVLALLGGFGRHVVEVLGPELSTQRIAFISRAEDTALLRQPPAPFRFTVQAGPGTGLEQLVDAIEAADLPAENVAVLTTATPNGDAPDAHGQAVLSHLLAAGYARPGLGLVPPAEVDVTRARAALDAWLAAPERVRDAGDRIQVAVVLAGEPAAGAALLRGWTAAAPADARLHFFALGDADGLAHALASTEGADPPCGAGVRVASGVPDWTAAHGTAEAYRVELAAANPLARPGDASYEGYLTARLLLAALEAQGRDLNGEVVAEALERAVVPSAGRFSADSHRAIALGTLVTITPACELRPD